MNYELKKNETKSQKPQPTQGPLTETGVLPCRYVYLPFPYQSLQNNLNQSLPYSVSSQSYPYLPPLYTVLPPPDSTQTIRPVPATRHSPNQTAPSQITKVKTPAPRALQDQLTPSPRMKKKRPAPPPPRSNEVQHPELSQKPCRSKTTVVEKYGAVPTMLTQVNKPIGITNSSYKPVQPSAPLLEDLQDDCRYFSASCDPTQSNYPVAAQKYSPDQPALFQIMKMRRPASPSFRSKGTQRPELVQKLCHNKTTPLKKNGAFPTVFTQMNRPISIIDSSHTPEQPSAPPLDDLQDDCRHFSASCNSIKSQSLVEKKKKVAVKLTPTVSHNPDSNAFEDAKILRKTLKSLMTDGKVIFDVLGNRNNIRRLEIADAYDHLYKKKLTSDLRSELSGRFLKSESSGEFLDLIEAMMKPSLEFYTEEIYSAIWGNNSKNRVLDENILIEIFCTLGNKDIDKVCEIFKEKYNIELKSIIKEGTPGNSGKILLSLCAGKRDESNYVDVKAAEKDARILSKAEAQQFKALYSILEQRNIYQLKQIFQEYKSITSTDIYEHPQFKDFEKSLHSIVKFVSNRAEFFANQLHSSMTLSTPRHLDLIRIIVTRAEIDMGEIIEAFYKLYEKTLEKFISECTSGNYKKCLIAIIS